LFQWWAASISHSISHISFLSFSQPPVIQQQPTTSSI
jgi:hypothetical protein